MTLGIRRQQKDLDGHQTDVVTNQDMFKGQITKDGKIENFNAAAGQEH